MRAGFLKPSPTDSGFLVQRDFGGLGKLTGAGAAVELIKGFLCEILPSGDVDGFEPALLSPAPGGALRHSHLLQPSGEADHCRAKVWICFAVRFNFHTPHLAARPADVGVSRTRDLNWETVCC